MSRQSVRTGIAAFLGGTYDPKQRVYRSTPALITGVGSVRDAFAKRMPETEFFYGLGAGARSGAVIIVHVGRQEEKRLTVPAVQGFKKRVYDITLHVYHLSKAAHAEDALGDLDVLLDALVTRMEADPTLGGCCFEAMETPAGHVINFGEPSTKGERTESYAAVTFQAVEHVQA